VVPWELGFVVVISVRGDGGGERGVGVMFGGRWTRAWIFVSGVKAFVASSVSLSFCYYQNIICIVFIIQVVLGSSFSDFLIGTIIICR
jgi:hypothetical protein